MSAGTSMAGRRRVISDETLDRELGALVAVDPSPAFVPRIRERVAGERIGEPWWRVTWVPAMVAAFALVLFVGLGLERTAVQPTAVDQAPASASTTPGPSLPEAVIVPGAVLARAPQARGAGRRTRRTPAAADPFDDIQLSAAEQQVLRALTASWRDATQAGLVMPDMTPLPRGGDDQPVLVADIAVPDITVARVVIEPTALMSAREE